MNPHTVSNLYTQFQQQYQQGNFQAALSSIAQIIQHQPNDAEALSNAATAATHAGQADLAVDYALKALKIQADYANALHVLKHHFHRFYRAALYEKAWAVIEKLVFYQPHNVGVLSDAASTASRVGKNDLAIAYAEKSLQINPDYINSHDVLSLNYGLQKNWQKTQQHGLRALQLRDAKVLQNFRLPENQIRKNGKKIIAFSLFGERDKYVEGAVLNAEIAPEWYPDWQCRFYVDDSVGETTRQRLRDLGAEVVVVQGEAKNWVGTVWRFLALDDETVARVIFRDCDSVISAREAMAVNEWVASGKRFHTIRDGATHTELILAGLWGAMGGAIDDITGKLRAHFSQPPTSQRFTDQIFLRDNIWAYVRNDVFSHDRLFGFMNPHALPETSPDYDYVINHIGACETSFIFPLDCPFPDGTIMNWQLMTRIAPSLNHDGSLKITNTMREICHYHVPVQHGRIELNLPRRYAKGLATGDTIINIHTNG